MQHVTNHMNKMLMSNSSSNVCSACQLGKSHRLPISYVHKRSQCMFAIIHVDMWGPAPVSSNHGMKYFFSL